MSIDSHTTKKIKGVFVHPCVRSYRVGLFNEISKFFDLDVIESSYPSSGGFVEKDREDSINKLNRKPIEQTARKLFNFDTSVFKLFSQKYSFVIYSSFISYPFILTVILAKLCGKKVLVFDELWQYPTTLKFKLLRFIFKFLGNFFVDGFILTGTKSFDFNKKFFSKTKNRVVAYNTNSYYENELSKLSRDNSILYLGRIVKIKGLDKLIAALPSLDVNLTVVGGGDEKYINECVKLAKDLGVYQKIEFLGECQKSDTKKHYSRHSVFCLPSQFVPNQSQQLESWGFTVNEALECGCKVLISDKVGSSFDLVRSGFNGYIFKSEDCDDLAIKAKLISELKTEPYEIKEDLMIRFNHLENAKVISRLIKGLF